MTIKPKKKIGEFLLERNFLTSEQVEEILDIQQNKIIEKFGVIALLLDYINSDMIKQYEAYINSVKIKRNVKGERLRRGQGEEMFYRGTEKKKVRVARRGQIRKERR